MAPHIPSFPARLSRARRSAPLLAVWLLLAAAPACLADGGMTPELVAKTRAVTQARISPDGRYVAYLQAVPRDLSKDKDGPSWVELHVTDRDGATRTFITGQVNISQIAWRPGTPEISFLAKRDNDKQRALYAIPLDGGEARKLFEYETALANYSWSPDGKRVAFTATEPEPKPARDLKDKGFSQQVYEEDWRPGRAGIVEPGAGDAKPRLLELPGSAAEAHWSPDGKHLAVVLAPTPLVDDSFNNSKVHIVEVESGSVTGQVEHTAKLGKVAWSTSGAHLAIIAGEDINDPAAGRLLVSPVSGGKPQDVLPGYQGHVSDIAWRDARTIAYIGDEGVWTRFAEVGLDGDRKRTLIEPGGPVFGSFSLADKGAAAAFTASSPAHPPEAYFSTAKDRQARRLTTSNPWLKDVRLARQEVVKYKARDGLELEGILIRPLDEQPGQRYPLILAVHGGPESHIPNVWLTNYSYPGQTAAARGFAVFYPNYRGSTGRGVDFSKTSQRDPAGKEFDDFVDAIDHFAAAGLVDPKKVGITGGSYGGYASAWGATYYSDRFAASVMFVGLSNLISKMGTTDIPEEMYNVHHRKRLIGNWQFFLERSPIYYVDRARTPLLILHGKEDPRVHPAQSLELYRLIKLAGNTPVRLIYYPGEGHGNLRAASRYDYSLRMLQWMEHYLQGSGGEPPPPALEYGDFAGKPAQNQPAP